MAEDLDWKSKRTPYFIRFWDAWPNNKGKGYEEYLRKTNQKQCWLKWSSRGLEKIGQKIVDNVEARRKFDIAWRKDSGKYLTAPLVFINNDGWEDEEWADWREEERKSRRRASAPALEDDVSTENWSKIATYTNRVLLQFIKRHYSRGKQKITDAELADILALKAKLNQDVNRIRERGEEIAGDDLKDLVYTNFERIFDTLGKEQEPAF